MLQTPLDALLGREANPLSSSSSLEAAKFNKPLETKLKIPNVLLPV